MWKKYPLELTLIVFVLLSKIVFSHLENRVQSLEMQLKECQRENREANAERAIYDRKRADYERELRDKYIQLSIEREAARILRPKIDSIKNL